VTGNRLMRIVRTGRIEPAGRAQNRGKDKLVGPDKSQDRPPKKCLNAQNWLISH
jgi:hypothetical protein